MCSTGLFPERIGLFLLSRLGSKFGPFASDAVQSVHAKPNLDPDPRLQPLDPPEATAAEARSPCSGGTAANLSAIRIGFSFEH